MGSFKNDVVVERCSGARYRRVEHVGFVIPKGAACEVLLRRFLCR